MKLKQHPARVVFVVVLLTSIVTLTWYFNQGSSLIPMPGRETACPPQTVYDYCVITHQLDQARDVNIAFTPDSSGIITAAVNTLNFWTLDGAQHQAQWFDEVGFDSVMFASDGDHIVSARGREIQIWPLAERRPPQMLKQITGHLGGIGSVALTADGSWLISGGSRKLLLWDVETGEIANYLINLGARIQSLSLSPDGAKLAAISPGVIRVFSIPEGDLIYELLQDDTVTSIAFSVDGTKLFTAGMDKLIHIWDSEDGTHLAGWAGHEHNILSMAVSPDGNFLATASSEGVNLWSLPSGKLIDTLQADALYTSLLFSPDSTLLATAGLSSMVKIWRIQ